MNAWDAASARVFESLGFPAVATTSSGIANALGYPDGQKIPVDEMLTVLGWITRAVSVPVTADIEAGYGRTIDDAVSTVKRILDAGAVGFNLEDSPGEDGEPLLDVAFHVAKIRALRAAADATGIRAVINARTDVYLHAVGEPSTRFDRTVERLNAYRDAGADCLFAPGVTDADTIRAHRETSRISDEH